MKKLIAVILAVLMAVSIVACTSSIQNNGPKEKEKEKVLRIDESNLGYPSVYTVSSRGRGYLLMSFIFDTLTWKDEKGVIPMLAEKWNVSQDHMEWTFNLVKNAKFTDGKPVTAEDVKFSFDYIKQHPHPWVSLKMVDEVRVIDKNTVAVKLNQIYAPFITDIAGNVPIMPKHIWEKVNEPEKFNTEDAVIGSGPFKLAQYDKDAGTYVYVANPDYFMGKPAVDKLIMSASKNPKESLEKGELDCAQQVKYGEAMAMKKEGKFKVIEGPGFWVSRVYFNFAVPEFNTKEFRQALYYAINRQEIVDKGTKGSGVSGNSGHIHPDSEWFFKDVKQYDFNPDKAKQLLDTLNMKDSNNDSVREISGKAIEYELLVTDDNVSTAEMIKSYLAAIGIKLNVKAMDQKSVDSMIKEGKFQIAINGHGSFGGDPVLLARFTSPKVVGSTPAITGQGGKNWSSEKFDKLFEEQIVELDKDKRYEKVGELQKIIAEELPTLTLFYKKIVFVYDQNKFDGFFFTKDGVAIAVPTTQNKLVYIRGQWKDSAVK